MSWANINILLSGQIKKYEDSNGDDVIQPTEYEGMNKGRARITGSFEYVHVLKEEVITSSDVTQSSPHAVR